MNIIGIGFILLAFIVIGITLALLWHWKNFMPESGRGVTVFTIYIIGLGVLFLMLYSSLSGM